MSDDPLTKRVDDATRRKYQNILENVGQVPTLPTIVARALEIIHDPNSQAEELGRLLSKDPALSVKVLRLANSAFYGIPRSISSINQAVIILGFNTLRSLVLSATVFKLFTGNGKGLDRGRYWKHSVSAAMATRLLARKVARLHSVNVESAFMAGLLHKIGILIFEVVAEEEHGQVLARAEEGEASLAELEKQVLGLHYADLGGMLAERWELPEELQQPIVCHIRPSETEEWDIQAALVHAGAFLAEQCGASLLDRGITYPLDPTVLELLQIPPETLPQLLEELRPELASADSFFNLVQG
ncbi:MAG: hypothetical protein RL318_701 [Fibrobacterota bacterium]|jgi:HD-like signal output (HDOD) protein